MSPGPSLKGTTPPFPTPAFSPRYPHIHQSLTTPNSPPRVSKGSLAAFCSIAFLHTLDDEDNPGNDAHYTHKQPESTHQVLFSFWEGGMLFKLWGKEIKQRSCRLL